MSLLWLYLKQICLTGFIHSILKVYSYLYMSSIIEHTTLISVQALHFCF